MKKLRIGILGAGWAAKGHALGFSAVPEVEIAALWSRERARAEGLAASLPENRSIVVYNDWRDLIDRAAIDLLVVATPPTHRAGPALMALGKGLHLIVEKPLCEDLNDGRAIVAASRKVASVTANALVWRYAPGPRATRRAFLDGRLGGLIDLTNEWRLGFIDRKTYDQKPWRRETTYVAEGGPHNFDQVRFVSGAEFQRVVCRAPPVPHPADPTFTMDPGAYSVVAEMVAGPVAAFRLTRTMGQTEWSTLYNFEKGNVRVTNAAAMAMLSGNAAPQSLPIADDERFPEGANEVQECWNRMAADFVGEIRGEGRRPRSPLLATLDDGLKAQEVVGACLTSNKEKRWAAVAG